MIDANREIQIKRQAVQQELNSLAKAEHKLSAAYSATRSTKDLVALGRCQKQIAQIKAELSEFEPATEETESAADAKSATSAIFVDAVSLEKRAELWKQLYPKGPRKGTTLDYQAAFNHLIETGSRAASITKKMVSQRAEELAARDKPHQKAIKTFLATHAANHYSLNSTPALEKYQDEACVVVYAPINNDFKWVIYSKISGKKTAEVRRLHEQDAKQFFKESTSGAVKIPRKFLVPADASAKAHDFINSMSLSGTTVLQIETNLSFVLAVAAHINAGKPKARKSAQRLLSSYSSIISVVGNLDILDLKQYNTLNTEKLDFTEQMKKLARDLTQPLRGEKLTYGSFELTKINPILTGLDAIAKKMHEAKRQAYNAIAEALKKALIELGKSTKLFNSAESHIALPFSDLTRLLDYLGDKERAGLAMYHYIILSLSTMMRPEEMMVLDKNHLIAGSNRLNYGTAYYNPLNPRHRAVLISRRNRNRTGDGLASQIAPSSNEISQFFLVNKVQKKSAADKDVKLKNPKTSIVTRIILKHYPFSHPEVGDYKTFWDRDGKARTEIFESEIAQAKGYIRCLRTTAATYLNASQLSSVGRRFPLTEVMERGGWADLQMLQKVYAREAPTVLSGAEDEGDDFDVDSTFRPNILVLHDLDGTTREVVGQDIAFDHFLLEHMRQTYETHYSSLLPQLDKHIIDELRPKKRYEPGRIDVGKKAG